ncbi:MAG: S41 family peptidase [Patescibacteria group bacterium]|nr:S-layer homology domain-containing protein [Patescibacteria group bacterium]
MFKKFLLSLSVLFLLIPITAKASFTDIPETSKYYEAVKYLEEKGAIQSVVNSKFRPESSVNRAEFLKMILLESGVEVPEIGVFTGLKDVKKDVWFAPYIKKAMDLNIIDIKNYFQPERAVKRGEGLSMIFELKGIGIPKVINTQPYKDVSTKSKFAGVAQTALGNGLFSETTFKQYKSLTRGEIAQVLHKLQNPTNIPIITIEFTSPQTNSISNNKKFQILQNAWETILQNYLKKDEINEDELLYGAIEGLVEKLNDPYSTFQEPLEAEILQTSLRSDFEGIGVMVEMIDSKFTVIAPLKDSPAEKVGIKAGDVVTHVNGENVSDMRLEEIVSKIKGPAGTTVELTIMRGDSSFDTTVERAKILLEAVSGRLRDDTKIGIITITGFTQNTAIEFANTANKLIKEGAIGFVIDLRNNPGGFLDAVVSMLHHYVEKDSPILSAEYASGIIETIYSHGPADFADIPTVTLINSGTASASEIFAGVLQDYNIGKIMGEKTFGKGTVQQLVNYGDGSILKLTIAKWLTANMRDIDGMGVEPALSVVDNADTKTDEALETAIMEVLSNI